MEVAGDSDEDLEVTGNICDLGMDYALEEIHNPVRTLTSTVVITGAPLRRCPVRSSKPIPKRLMLEAMKELDGVRLTAPVDEGYIVIPDILGTGIPIITTRNMRKKNT